MVSGIQSANKALSTICAVGLTANKRAFSTGSRMYGREKLVILGTGWGSYSVLRNINKKLYDVVVISPRNHFLFTPLLCSTTVGTLEFRSIIEPVRNAKFRNESDFHLAKAVSIDTRRKVVKCARVIDPEDRLYEVRYDHLVIGVGARPNSFNTTGVEEHAHYLKEISDARKIRNKLLANFEKAVSPSISLEERSRLHHLVIVGGGPTGVEFGAELHDFLKQDVRRLYSQTFSDMRVTLIEGNHILASFDDRLRKYAEKKIRQRDQFHLVKDLVSEVTPKGVQLVNGGFLPCGLVVWSAGIAPTDFIHSLPFKKNRLGQVITDDRLKVMSADNSPMDCIYALGDCADIDTEPLPCTAQVAEKEGCYLAEQLNGKESRPFVFKGVGQLAYLGDFKALSDLSAFKDKGFSSWILWRSAYLTKLGSWRLRMQVPLDWMKTFFFGRDTSRFD